MQEWQGQAAGPRPRWVRAAWWAVAWFGVGLLIYLSLMRNPPHIDIEQSDKLQHLAAYAVLTAWWMQLWLTRGPRVAIALALFALGVYIEFAQAATGYRSYSYGDMAADAAGIALGWLAAPPRMPHLLRLLEHRFATR